MLRLCYKEEHTKKNCESKLNIFITFKENLSTQKLKRMIEEYETVKSIKIKEVLTGQEKQEMVCFPKEKEAQEAITGIKWYVGWNAEVYRNAYNKKRTDHISNRI